MGQHHSRRNLVVHLVEAVVPLMMAEEVAEILMLLEQLLVRLQRLLVPGKLPYIEHNTEHS